MALASTVPTVRVPSASLSLLRLARSSEAASLARSMICSAPGSVGPGSQRYKQGKHVLLSQAATVEAPEESGAVRRR